MPLENERTIIRRCQDGELEAFGMIYQHYEKHLLKVAWRLLDTREAAEDALQDAMLNAYRRIGTFRREAALSTWLHRIVVNTCYDRLRRSKRSARVDTEREPEITITDDSEFKHHLRQAIAELPAKAKACFVLYCLEGYKQWEIAEMLDMREGTVKSHVFRAKEQLRESLAPRLKGLTP